MNNLKTKILLFFSICIIAVSCSKYEGFKRSSSGYHYKFHSENKSEIQPEIGDFIEVSLKLYTDDTIISPTTRNKMIINENTFKGDLYCALRTMHLGDSATFIFNGKKFYEDFLMMGNYPFGKKPIFADVKMLKILSKNNIEQAIEQYQMREQQQAEIEDSLVTNYAAKELFSAEKINGIYIAKNKKSGNNKNPKNGDEVKIIFQGRFLDGRIQDNCLDKSKARTFTVGKGEVASGWEIVVKQMHVGDSVTCVIPSKYMFGEGGSELYNIPPYTPFVYDIELLEIIEK